MTYGVSFRTFKDVLFIIQVKMTKKDNFGLLAASNTGNKYSVCMSEKL